MNIVTNAAGASLLLLASITCAAAANAPPPPRLILQITIDALRGDLPERFGEHFGADGFRYLMEQGVNYTDAHYEHANTETIVGHASLATGAPPLSHGMIGNVWFDRSLGRLVYNIEDSHYRLLTAGADVDQENEIDPTQKAAKVEGRSPNAILSSTFSDELALHYGGQSKIFGVSVKDRGAVSMAGHTGKAFWFSKANGEFVTSTYYYEKYPDWVVAWNAGKPAAAFAGTKWTLLREAADYRFAGADDNDYEMDFPGYGRTFPHAYGSADDKYFTTRLTLGPAGDALTLDFAKTLLDNEGLGKDEVPDYLSISFSSTDYVGHLFGASSLESEDNLLQLDRTLADLFAYVDKKIGLDKVLIVLSADHGQPEVPGHLHELGIEAARHFDVKALEEAPAVAAVKKQLGLGDDLIEAFFQPYIYLNRKAIAARGLDLAVVEQQLAGALRGIEGIEAAVPSSAVKAGAVSDTRVMQTVVNNFHERRSGDIYLVFQPSIFINDLDGLTVPSMHGSPWRYDTYVPVIFAGAKLQARKVSRSITPYDIAPTLSARLGMKPPSGATGQPLSELVGR
ncbi:MAG: alkaline phosphatase family protein [Gammaproteobacteria bacterium]|jgi:predicted AlkP superfamily pyrophosphatase or phosphodiesterase